MKMFMAAIALVFSLMIGNTAPAEAAAPGAAVPALQTTTTSAVEAVHYRKRHYGYRHYRAPRLYYGYSYRPRYYAPRKKYYRKHYRPYRHYRHYRRW